MSSHAVARKMEFDLILAADESEIEDAANDFSIYGGDVIPVEADLATIEGVEKLYAANDSSHVAV
jgi:UDP-N-acetylglucosamine enolpyruvyl transferase